MKHFCTCFCDHEEGPHPLYKGRCKGYNDSPATRKWMEEKTKELVEEVRKHSYFSGANTFKRKP